jgi:dipeptidyl aminopeptidase/acylaminoacyl peptidase
MKISQSTNTVMVIILILLFLSIFCVSCQSNNLGNNILLGQKVATNQVTMTTPVPSLAGETNAPDESLTPTPFSISLTITSQGEASFKLPDDMYEPTIDKNRKWLTFGFNNEGGKNDQGVSVYNVATCKIDLSDRQILLCSQLDLYLENETWFAYRSEFSPDGKYFAVSTAEHIWIYETNNWQQIVEVDKKKIRPDIAWSPDSQGIAVQFNEEGNVLYYLRFDGTRTPLLTMNEVFPEGFPPSMPGVVEWGPTWSPDGRQIAYIKYYPNHDELWVKNVVNGKNEMLYKGTGSLGANPKWSPSGRYISMYGGGLQVFDLQTHILQTFLKSPYSIYQDFFDEDYVWSSQGNQIAVKLTYDDVNKTGLYILDVDTGKMEFVKQGLIQPHQWLADNTLVFTYYNNDINSSFLGWMNAAK